MGTADSDDYTKQPCAFQAQQTMHEAEIKRFNRRVMLEPLLILCVIVGYCALQASMQQRDLKAQQAEAAKQRDAICQIKQHNTLHQFNCQVINAKLAVTR